MLHRHRPDWGSHIPVLINAVKQSTGPVLELGLGIHSTPLLHMLCEDIGRQLYSYDNDPQFTEMFKKYRSKNHSIKLLDDWVFLPKHENVGVVLADHKPERQRRIDAVIYKEAEFVILHDSEPENEHLYRYSEIYPLFKYRFDYTKFPVRTTVLSNHKPYAHD